jgi:hypothetical protein
MSLSKKDNNMCFYISLANSPKVFDSPDEIKRKIAQGKRRERGVLGSTDDLPNFGREYECSVIIFDKYGNIIYFYKTPGKEKDFLFIKHSTEPLHFSSMNSISHDEKERFKIMAKDFHDRQLQTHFTDNAYESQLEQAIKNSIGNYHDDYELQMVQAMENSMKIQSKPKEDTSTDAVLAQSLQEQFEREQKQIWQDNAYAGTF